MEVHLVQAIVFNVILYHFRDSVVTSGLGIKKSIMAFIGSDCDINIIVPQQVPYDGPISLVNSSYQRSPTVEVPNVGVCIPMFKQQLHDMVVALYHRQKQCSTPLVVSYIGICIRVFEQSRCLCIVVIGNRLMKNGVSIVIYPIGIDVPVCQKHFHHLCIRFPVCDKVKRSIALPLSPTIHFNIVFQQYFDDTDTMAISS